MIYIVQEAFKGFGKNKSMSFITVGIITISIFIFGLFIVGTANLMNIIKMAEDKIEMIAYVEDDASDEDIAVLKRRILSIAGVQDVEFISKDMALKKFKSQFADNSDLLTVFETNPLPASFKIFVSMAYKNPDNLREISNKIMLFENIDSIDYGAEWIEELDRAVKILFLIDLILGIIIALSSIFIVFNTIRLTVYARKEQIDIMDLVGATSSYIEIPYIIEGIIHGLTGSIISAGILYLLMKFLSSKLPDIIFMNNAIMVILVIFGVLLGFTGSFMSVKQCMKEIREMKVSEGPKL
ncbi:MAG: permease-like cell division protein FtsX [candidate division WOR-3 bacterium]|nr:permease-like cell division protein FtsX [candidate division WOR-3 bacterium]